MKKLLISLCLAGASIGAVAQTHAEGVEYYKADQLANAKELLLRNLSNPATDKAVSNYYLGLIALQEGNKDEAARYFQQGVQANPDYAYNYVGLGGLALKSGNVKEAEADFKKAEQLTKKDPAIHVAIARAYYEANPEAYQKMIDKRLERARKIDMKHPDLFIFEGDCLVDDKNVGGAAAKYEMASTVAPQATEAFVKYANLYSYVNPEYAIKMLTRLLELNPTSALGQRELAKAYYNNKDYKNAVREYAKYNKNPNHFKQDEDRYAFLLFYNGDYQQGYDFATKQLKANPANFTAQRYQFMNAAQLPEMKDEMMTLADKLYANHKANPANKFAPIDYTLVAEELTTAKRTDEAIEVLREAIKENPESSNFDKQLAMVYVDEGDLVKASQAYDGYLAKTAEPGYNDYIQQAIFCYYAGVQSKDDKAASAQHMARATEFANKAAEAYPDFYRPKKILGDIAKQQAAEADVETAAAPMYLESIALLEQAPDPMRYTGDAKEMYNYMGNYYLVKNDKEKAKEYFNKYLKYDPNNEDYRKFVESL